MKHRGAPPNEERTHAGPVVGVLEKHGRFLAVTPFFARGRRINVDRSRTGRARPGDLVLVEPKEFTPADF